MLDLNIIRSASMQKNPYSWIKLQNIIPIEERIDLAKYYPEEQFFHKNGAEWTPMTGPCLNEKIGILSQPPLKPVWNNLIVELRSPTYRYAFM